VCVRGYRATERVGERKRHIKVVKKGAKTVSDLSHGRDASRTDDWTGDCIKAIYNIMRDATPPPPTYHYCVGIQKTILYIIIIFCHPLTPTFVNDHRTLCAFVDDHCRPGRRVTLTSVAREYELLSVSKRDEHNLLLFY